MEIVEVERIGSRSFGPVRHSNEEERFECGRNGESMERDKSTLTSSTCEFDEALNPANAKSTIRVSLTSRPGRRGDRPLPHQTIPINQSIPFEMSRMQNPPAPIAETRSNRFCSPLKRGEAKLLLPSCRSETGQCQIA